MGDTYESAKVMEMSLLIGMRSKLNLKPHSALGRQAAQYLTANRVNRVQLADLIDYRLLSFEQVQALLRCLTGEPNYFGVKEAAHVLDTTEEIVEGFLRALAVIVAYPLGGA